MLDLETILTISSYNPLCSELAENVCHYIVCYKTTVT